MGGGKQKLRQIFLEQHKAPDAPGEFVYRVSSLTNIMQPIIGTWFRRVDVEQMNKLVRTQIRIIEPDSRRNVTAPTLASISEPDTTVVESE